MQKKVFALFKSSYFSSFVVIAGTFLSLVIAWQSSLWIENSEKTRFTSSSEHILFLAEKQLQSNVQLLCGASAFIRASSHVSREEWKIFAQSQYLSKRFPSIQGLGFSPLVKRNDVAPFVDAIKAEGFVDFAIFPPSLNAHSIVITYLEPFDTINRKALGFDMAAEPVRKATMDMAAKRGVATLSAKIELVQGTTPEEKAGFAIYVPLYATGKVPSTVEEKEKSVTGFVFAGIKARTLFENLTQNYHSKVDFEIFDGTAMQMHSKLFDSNPALKNARYEHVTTIALYGREWTFNFKADEVFDIGLSRYIPYAQAFFGILFALIVGRWIAALQRTREEAYRIADEKTKRLVHSEAEVRTIFQAMHEGVIVQNAQGVIVECNLAAQEIFGMPQEEMLGKTSAYPRWSAIYEDGSVMPTHERPAPRALQTGKAQENVIMGIVREDSFITWVQANAQPIFSDDFSHVESVLVTLSDITEYRKSKLKLEEYIAIIDANVIISSTDLEGIITEVSEAFCAISGYTKEELLGKNHNMVRHADMPDLLYVTLWEALKRGETWHGEMKNRHKNGSAYWVDATISPRHDDLGAIVGYTAIREDITDKKRIEELSITDRLTGLYNRLKLDELFEQHLNVVRRHGKAFAIILADIDYFKSVNDTYGHQAGDIVLQEFSMVMKQHLRLEDDLGRWGGEEFLILVPNVTLEGAVRLASKLRECVEKTNFHTVGHKTCSLGVASFHEGDDAKSMVARADEALYRAKTNGRNRVEAEIHTCEIGS